MKLSFFILYSLFLIYVTNLTVTQQNINTDEERESALLSRLRIILGVDTEGVLMLVSFFKIKLANS